jgi:6,7-dimethyl-8-ribityllumazine synthase
MTSSDLTLLPDDAKDRAAARAGTVLDGASTASAPARRRARVAFACAEFNGGVTDRMLTAALDELEDQGCGPDQVVVAWAPGAFELPLVARQLATSGAVDAVVCLGAVIRGDTGHYDFVAGQCASGLQQVQLETGIPVVFGVLTTDTVEQALVRSQPDHTNKGREAARTALETVAVLAGAAGLARPASVGFGRG